jgi:FAD/FMN-containing dehydrogenase/Fe-S oxidoreductase
VELIVPRSASSKSLKIIQNDDSLETPSSGVSSIFAQKVNELKEQIAGELRTDKLYQMLYAQDASIYREEPLGVVFPLHKEDLKKIVAFAQTHNIPLIPRGAGTSLTGQCVGNGLVVDLGRYMNNILDIDPENMTARVQPGVIRDDLNRAAARYGLFFAPETSTTSRCMLGGMIANNSCGTNSVKYGNTRDHVRTLELLFADGTIEECGRWTNEQFRQELEREDLFGEGLRSLERVVRLKKKLIQRQYPRPDVIRRNTGYPFDIISCNEPFTEGGKPFSFVDFLCGSEGTLAIITEAEVVLTPLPRAKSLMCVHFSSIDESLRATLVALKHQPSAVEIIDKRTLDSARLNIEQEKNRFFIEGDPAAIIAIECEGNTQQESDAFIEAIKEDLKKNQFGYAHPIIPAEKTSSVWELRKEGLGIVMGQPGDVKPETFIEDTAIPVDRMPEYIAEVLDILAKYDTPIMIYGHVSVGVVHLRPEINLRDGRGKEIFLKIADEVADLVLKYNGALSGEHGDGRIRSPFLEKILGSELMDAHREVKQAFDPHGIFNPGKIVNPKSIEADWRVATDKPVTDVATQYDWSAKMGLVRAVEKCNGVGVCRKGPASGGTMCPSYMATLDEKDSTRGRANLFQQLFINNKDPRKAFLSEDLYDALDLCLSCKGCKRECPSNIDMARMKAEFLQAYYDVKGVPLSSRLFGHYRTLCKLGSLTPRLANFFMTFAPTKRLLSYVMKVSPKRSLPLFAEETFRSWFSKRQVRVVAGPLVWLYVDPFTEFTEPDLAKSALVLLERAGYRIELLPIEDDGRTLISKGLLRDAKALIKRNLVKLKKEFEYYPHVPIVGIEPSALLTFRDETIDLVDDPELKEVAKELSQRSRLFEEFLLEEKEKFSTLFTSQEAKKIVLHGHCHQKALVGIQPTVKALELAGYEVETLATGCCGMAGSFGYEKEHYTISMNIGELALFPALREKKGVEYIAAPGTSCRHQIKDGVGSQAYHPIQLIEKALSNNITVVN